MNNKNETLEKSKFLLRKHLIENKEQVSNDLEEMRKNSKIKIMIIEPKYVSFEIAKKLKEIGYDAWCNTFYQLALKSKKDEEDGFSGPFGWKKGEMSRQEGFFINNDKIMDSTSKYWYLCACPQQWQVLEWLEVKHRIHVEILLTPDHPYDLFYVWIQKIGEYVLLSNDDNYFKTTTEAKEHALNIILSGNYITS